MVQEGGAKKKGGKGGGGKGKKKAEIDQQNDEVVEVQNEEGATALMLACQREEIEHVKALLQKGGGINISDYTGKTTLHYCVENNNTEIAELIVEKSPPLLNKKDRDGYTPLHLSVIANNKKMICCLLDSGADIAVLDNEGHNTIHWATVCGHVDLIDFLQERGAKLNRPDKHNAFALHYAAQMCGAKSGEEADPRTGRRMLNKLLEKDVDVDCRDQDKRTPLIWAASSGSKDAMECLITLGASVNTADKDGLTALHCATSRGHNRCADLLMKHGASVNSPDKNGCTPLFYAITLGHNDCAKNLLKNGANPNHKDNRGRTPGHCAAAKGSKNAIKMLQSHSADLWTPNNKGERPVHEAALAKETDAVKYLLDKNRDKEAVNTSNNENRSVLHIAAITNNLQLCKMLVGRGAKNNSTMKHKKFKDKKLSPYQAAVLKGSAQTAEYLAPITDPPSDIDDEEWESRRKQEREKELIRQRDRELQKGGEVLERAIATPLYIPRKKEVSEKRVSSPPEPSPRRSLGGSISTTSSMFAPSPSVSINLNSPEPMSEQGEISVDLVREPTFSTLGSVTPPRHTPLPTLPKTPEPQMVTLPEFTDSDDDDFPEMEGFVELNKEKQEPNGDKQEEAEPEGDKQEEAEPEGALGGENVEI